MAVTLINPEGLPDTGIYQHVSVATGSKLIHVAGQVAWDGGDLATQVEQSYLNAATALAAAGASFDDVVKVTVHVVDWQPEKMAAVLDGISRAATKLDRPLQAPASLYGIVALDVPEHLVEVDVVAVLD
jgi:enamine deaminase RidA (YjgF/YER057c/UK114 family)